MEQLDKDAKAWRKILEEVISHLHRDSIDRCPDAKEAACCALMWAAEYGHHRYAETIINESWTKKG